MKYFQFKTSTHRCVALCKNKKLEDLWSLTNTSQSTGTLLLWQQCLYIYIYIYYLNVRPLSNQHLGRNASACFHQTSIGAFNVILGAALCIDRTNWRQHNVHLSFPLYTMKINPTLPLFGGSQPIRDAVPQQRYRVHPKDGARIKEHL